MSKKQELETAQERVQELEEQLARISADYANYRRRTEIQAEENKKLANKQLITEILAVIDNLELAINQAKNKEDSLYQGVELVLGQLITVLESHGVQRISTEEGFDAHKHEALLSEHSKQKEGTILQILQPGYELAGKVLRTTKVKVSKGPQEKKEHE
ncbi:MAG: nucleotide exchange factor GrpE [Candidatus Woesearchaeota archaeon]